jgi:hypothetical protein
MAETLTKSIMGQDAERAQDKKRRLEPAPLPMKALADEAIPFSGLLGVSAMELPLESHAAFLGDPRFSHPANNTHKARMAMQLQQIYGNQYVQRLVESFNVQGKLTVGSPDDQYEREADRVADAVTRAPASSIQRQVEEEKEEEEEPIQTKLTSDIQVQRQEEEPEEEEEEPIQAKLTNGIQVQQQAEEPEEEEEEEQPIQTEPEDYTRLQRQTEEEEEEEEEEPMQAEKGGGQTPLITSSLESRINSLKGGGHSLTRSDRAFFEPRFEADFSNVRIHNDSRAAKVAQWIDARAFTIGRDIVFGNGEYSPNTHLGKELLAHELTHVIQQNGRDRLMRKRISHRPKGISQLKYRNNDLIIQRKNHSGTTLYKRREIPLPGLWKAKPVPAGLRILFRTGKNRRTVVSEAFWKYFVGAYGPLKYPFGSIVAWVKYSHNTSTTDAGATVYYPSIKKSRIFIYPSAFSSVEYFWSALSHEFIHALQNKRAAKLGIKKSLPMQEFEAYLWNLENCKITGTIYNSLNIADFILGMTINYKKVSNTIKRSNYWIRLRYFTRYRLINHWYSKKYLPWVSRGTTGSNPPAPPKIFIYIPSRIKRRLRY